MLKTILNDSTYLIGDGSSGKGNNKNFILEACEYRDTFLNYKPYIGLVLNIDYDHPDYFKDYNDYYELIMYEKIEQAKQEREDNLLI